MPELDDYVAGFIEQGTETIANLPATFLGGSSWFFWWDLTMDPKPKANRKLYMEVLRRMTPAQRLEKAMELSEFAKQLFRHGLRRRFPDADEKQIHEIYLKRIARCHNRNY